MDLRPSEPRLLPAVAILSVMCGGLLVARLLWPQSLIQYLASVGVPLLALVAIAVWWLGFSRVPPVRRLTTAVVVAALMGVSALIAHHSLVPFALAIYVLPMMLILPVLWLAASRGPYAGTREWGTYVAAAVPLVFAAGARVDGVSGTFSIAVSPRWSTSAEEKYLRTLAEQDDAARVRPLPADSLTLRDGDWPGFRGPQRDGTLPETTIHCEWSERPLPQVWRRRIGPGWSSFALVDGRLFTQEQRGEEEAIVCLDADTGAEVWAYSYPGRFFEMAANVGPRATPTFDAGRIFALGATGKLTALDAATGERLWQADITADSGAEVPEWGFASSPLVVDGRTVIVMAGQPGAKAIAYDAQDGSVRWTALRRGRSYSSPQLMTLDGVRQVVVMDSDGTFGLAPHTGEVLWSDSWDLELAARIVQPLQIGDDGVIIATGYGMGTRRIRVRQNAGGWEVTEQWHSRHLKPYFNDFVHHDGYLYGFDDQIVTCIDAATGERQWKKGRYGFGQMLLVADQDLLLVVGEQGKVVLVRASHDKSAAKELASFQAVHSKTWNHPVIAHGRLYLRNAQVAVCFNVTPP